MINLNLMQGLIPVELKRFGFNSLLKNFNKAGLIPTLSSEGGPYTVFAPTDEAFAAIPPDAVLAIEAVGWGRGLKRHIVRHLIPESSIRNGAQFNDTLRLGYEINISVNDKGVSDIIIGF